jgi:hypothetical protein
VCRLKKALYGLKQAPRAWYKRMDNFLMSLGFTNSKADPNPYYKVGDGSSIILLSYVDDLFMIGEENPITESKRKLAAEFKMKDLGIIHYFLGLEAWQRQNEIFINQGKYVVDIMKRFDMMDCKAILMPMVTKLKLLSDTSSETLDVTLYR